MAQDASQIASTTSVKDVQGGVGNRQDALKQFAESAGGDGTFFQQLTSNPFFTAVCFTIK